MVELFEFVAMGFSMLGAFYMSRGSHAMIKSFIAFGVSNMLLIIVSLEMGMMALLIQMMFFWYASYTGLVKFGVDKDTLSIITGFFAIGVIAFMDLRNMQFQITPIEVMAAIMAITGAIIIKHDSQRKNAFILYFVADILYVYIAISHGLMWFGIQSAFFIYTSAAGYIKENTKERLCIQ